MNFRQYFQPSVNYFWRPEAEDGTTVFCIPGDGTIVYSGFLMRVLEDLSSQGLPPLGALLLALTATNHSQGDPLQKVEDILRSAVTGFRVDNPSVFGHMLDEAMDFLRTLAALPLKYTGGEQRIQLFQVLFKGCHRQMSVEGSRDLLQAARQWIGETGKVREIPHELLTPARYTHDLKCLGLLSRQFPDEASIIGKLTTVPAIPGEILPEEEKEPGPADFVDSLIEQYSTFPIGILIRSIWSGLNIPIHHRVPGEQPLGGFSDLSNKGSFDKLLVSEFANDEWLLLSRLANNEALFLHREIPPGADDLRRILLLDISLKSWGTPKVLAYAVLLAIARHPRTDIPCTAFAVGDDCYPIAFDTVDDLIGSLKRLDGCLHPAGGLAKFFGKRTGKDKLEIIFIAPPDSHAHPAVKKVVSDHYSAFRYWVAVGREGEIDLYKNQNNSRRLIQQMRLPLEKLREEYKRKQPAGAAKPEDKLPSQPRKAEAPVLYPPSRYVKAYMAPPDGQIYYLDKWGKLFRLHRDANMTIERGWQLLFEDIPGRMTHFEVGETERGERTLLCFDSASREIIFYNLETGGEQRLRFDDWRQGFVHGGFYFSDGSFYFDNQRNVWKITDGRMIRLDGITSPDAPAFTDPYKRMQMRVQEAVRKNTGNRTILRHLNRVAVNAEGNLVFNKHEFLYKPSGHFILELAEKPSSREMLVVGQWDETGECFVFPGGNRVKIDRSGMLTLEWGQPKEPLFDVMLWNSGPNKLNAIKIVKDGAGSDLAMAQKLVVNTPALVLENVNIRKAQEMMEQLTATGAGAEVITRLRTIHIPAVLAASLGVATWIEFAGNDFYCPADHPMIKADPRSFFEKNIRSFIQHIQAHGTDSKTSS